MTSKHAAPAPLTVGSLAAVWRAHSAALSPAELNPIFVSSLGSTQVLAQALVKRCVHEDEGPLPFVVAAIEQTAGRGRQGRGWSSPRGGGLYASLVLPVTESERLQEFPLRTATALAEFLNGHLRHECRIKWPNDLVVGRRKIGGILVDALTPPSPAETWAIVGMGVNFLTPSILGGEMATSILEEGCATGLPDSGYEALVANAVVAVWNALHSASDDWVERFRKLSAHAPGEEIRFRTANEEVRGIFDGFDDRGFLLLRAGKNGAQRVVRSGEVFSW